MALAIWFAIPSARVVRLRALTGDRDPGSSRLTTWIYGRTSRRRSLDPRRRFTVALRALGSELTAGSTPATALERAAGDPPIWPRALAAARFGESVERGLIHDAQEAPELGNQFRQLAACWHIGSEQGAGLATGVERLALSVQSQFELRSVLHSELAAPRATARMLALLPIVGISMGYLLGADPVAWFLGSSVGGVVLVSAVALTLLGFGWTRRIVSRVERAVARG